MKKLKILINYLVAFVLMVVISSSLAQETYAIKGTIVTPDQVIEGGTILIQGNLIKEVGANMNLPAGTVVFDTQGIILPGFVDLHNHLTWNLLPRWKPGIQFSNRYEWQLLPSYGIALATPHGQLMKENLGCEMSRYAEVKAIIQGETSVVGGLFPAQECEKGFARNLDSYSGLKRSNGQSEEKLSYEVFPLELDATNLATIYSGLDNGQLTAFIVHLAEGKPNDASAIREFKMFDKRGLLRPGVSIIHGISLKQADFHKMKSKGVGLIWSPRSNIELYGATTDVAAALLEKVEIALSPDWSPTGSNGMLAELKYAAVWNAGQSTSIFSNQELVRMATLYPSKLARLDGQIGAIAPGLHADLVVLRKNEADAYDAIVHADPLDIELVVIDGKPVYGNLEPMKKLLPDQQLETIMLCGREKMINLAGESQLQRTKPKSWAEITQDLSTALQKWGSSLAPIADCTN
jgi:5-methylthioadenosine/S-adenosylhomocysteine deaminase